MKKHILLGVLTLLIIFSNSITTHAKESFFSYLGILSAYEVPNTEQSNLLLSRDGSYAVPVQKGMMIRRPGTYFLSELEAGKLKKLTKFQIPTLKDQSEWTVNSKEELPEILKYSLENYKEKITIKFNKGTYQINEMNNLIYSVIDELMETYPKVTYVSYKLTSYGTKAPKIVLEFTYALPQISLLKQYNQNTDKKVEELIRTLIRTNMTDYEREWVIANALINHLTYAKEETHLSHTMQGALTEGIAVCDGYAKSYMYLLNSVGIQTKFITGTATAMEGTDEKVPHAWNLIKLDDGYYHVDLTWADPDDRAIGTLYNYFNETDSYMKLTHEWQEDKFPKADGKAYRSIYFPLEQKGIYKVSNKKEWGKASKQLGKDGLKEANIIFYNLSQEKWSAGDILNQILKEEKKDMNYLVYYKYDSLVVSYKVN